MTHQAPMPSNKNSDGGTPAETSSVTPQRPDGGEVSPNGADKTQVIPTVTSAEATPQEPAREELGRQEPARQEPGPQKPATVGSAPRSGGAAQASNSAQQPGGSALVDVDRAITRIHPVSALKMALVFNLALFAVWVVAMALIYIILGGAGVWDRLNSLVADLTGSDGMTAGLYFGAVVALGLVEVVIFTLLAPVVALIYNSAATLFGGVRVTLDR